MKIDQLAKKQTVIVCCGAGGVGKTTVSAALALAAARDGRRALVLTIDPARRLAQALGIPPMGDEPARIDEERMREAGITCAPGGELHAWMLDPASVLESVVDRFAPSEDAARQIRATRLYNALKEVMAGLQEFTAAEALYDFTERNCYDLIVLDTPPSRNALDFLDAPRRLARFLDERTLAVFVPGPNSKRSAFLRAASKIVTTAMSKAFTPEFVDELQQFLSAFGTLFGKMRIHAKGVRKLLQSEVSSFIVITSTEEAAFEEALFFDQRVRELGLDVEGFVLNRSYIRDDSPPHPSDLGEAETDETLKHALEKLAPLAQRELDRDREDRKLFSKLQAVSHANQGNGAVALPYLDETVEDLAALAVLSEQILRPRTN